jgi:hypothetical protein
VRIKSYELHCHLALMNPNYPSQLNGTREILTTEANHFRLPCISAFSCGGVIGNRYIQWFCMIAG